MPFFGILGPVLKKTNVIFEISTSNLSKMIFKIIQ